jgi:hypothetical protein
MELSFGLTAVLLLQVLSMYLELLSLRIEKEARVKIERQLLKLISQVVYEVYHMRYYCILH